MKKVWYWSIAVVLALLVLGINLIFNFSFGTVLDYLLAFAFLIAPTVAVGIVFTMLMPKKIYNPDSSIFKEASFEKNMYDKLKVKKWKDYVPQFLRIDNIDDAKEDNVDVQNPEYLELFISETCRAEMVHFFYVAFVIVMFVLLLVINTALALKFGIAFAVVWILFNMASILIQRFNRPRLQELLKKVKANKKPKDNEDDNAVEQKEEPKMEPLKEANDQPEEEQKDQPAGEDNK